MDDLLLLFLLLASPVVSGFIGRWVARQKGRSDGEGFLLGFFLLIMGLIIEGVLPTIEKPKSVRSVSEADNRVRGAFVPADDHPRRKCPFCAEMILAEAIVCRYCQREVPVEQVAKYQIRMPYIWTSLARFTIGKIARQSL